MNQQTSMTTRRVNPTAAIIIGVLAVLVGVPVGATQVNEVQFKERFEVRDSTLERMGTGILRYMGFIKAYAGALYTLPGTDPETVLDDSPKRLEVEYFVALKGEDFGPATCKGLSRNISAEMIDRLRERIDYHNSLYVDVRPGDRYALTYLPGQGTELSLNGKRLGVIQGADFASAIFSLWLGETPFDRRFKQALLGMDG
jgi:hypothetical protein